MGTWGHHIGLRHLSWGSGEAVLQDGAPDGALLLRGHHWDVPIPCHRSFFLSQSLPWPGICRSTGFLPPGYISLLPSDVNLWLCPRVWWEPAEKEHCKWFLKCHLVTGWGEAPPPQHRQLWLLGPWIHTPCLLSLRSKPWAVSLHYEIKIISKYLKGENEIVFSFDCGHNKIAI